MATLSLELWLLIQLLNWTFAAKSSEYNPYGSQARLYSEDGHLFIVGGTHSNITLKTFGNGFININDYDLLHITEMAAKSAAFVHNFKQNVLPEIQSSQSGSQDSLLMARLRRLEAAMSVSNTTGTGGNQLDSRRLRILTRRVNVLYRSMRALRLLVIKDECDSSPCQNGGTCQDLFNSFHCRCTPQWEGDLCERDVDECSRLAGTGLGCQNGGTCRNLAGSYACTCPTGWYGLHCTQRTYDCSLQSSAELCGHGVCVNQGGTGRGFVCMCDPGWTKRDADGSCTIDKDECSSPTYPCSHEPHVACVNTPGSFQCSQCPRGYSGNGYKCADIDECEINNGGCSTSPMVQCINTRGSRVCGPCPPGYSGDGTICTAAGGRCRVNNGGCHLTATCLDNPALSYVQCVCPSGYFGTGIGPNGCLPGLTPNITSICNSNPCRNGGTCIPMSLGNYMCQCISAFTGPNCSVVADPCSSSPCKNGGTCVRTAVFRLIHYRCQCPRGYSGPTCAFQNEGCVGRYYQRNGTISYPAKNQTSWTSRQLVCAWTLYSPNRTQVINITFTDMQIGIRHLQNCYSNYIEVYDGDTSSSPLLGKYCGTQPPPPIITSHPVAFITAKFSFLRIHFSFNWTSVPRKCGGFVNASLHGTISSPGSPGKYPHKAHCVWKLFAPFGRRIRFTFFSLDIEDHRNCSFDYLEIRNGVSENGPLLRKFCRSFLPDPFITSGNEATVIFHSDSSRSAGGFQLSYVPNEGLPGCGGTFTNARGTIIAPSKPGGAEYQDDLNCEWLISLPQNEKIRIDVESLNLEKNVGCYYDYLSIFDGPSKQAGEVGRWCGNDKVPPFTSTSNEVLVVFESDSTYNEGGFTLKYKTVCGGLWSAPSGIIQSPYYPFHYPDDRTCTYTIQQPLGYAIKFEFVDFDLEGSEDCVYDLALVRRTFWGHSIFHSGVLHNTWHLPQRHFFRPQNICHCSSSYHIRIYDGNDENSPLIGKYCGTSKPGLIISKHNFLHVVFTTDSSNQGRGFKANYTAVDINCGGILTGKTGLINSPKYPEQYPLNKECTWVISAPVSTMIQLTWLSFNLEKSYSCTRDWVAVYDNNTILSYSGQLGNKYCGNVLPPAMTASSNLMSIILHTDTSVSAPGFSANYIAVDTKNLCGGNFLTVMGAIHSPNFPNGYPNKLDCRWVITVPTGQQIQLTSDSFSVESTSGGCYHDYLEIRNGGYENSPLIKRYCGSNISVDIISLANQLHLRFVSDSSVSAPGFKILWDGAIMGCGGVLTSPSGSIISPNYPQPYGKNGECTYKIAVSQGSAIQLIIVDLDLEEHSICALDYVQIYDGANKMSPKMARICSANHPPSLTSKGNLMFIMFRSDTSRQGRGFHFKYSTVCNITTKGFSGTIESPGFPEKDSIPRECFWKITAPLGNKINITFSHYLLGGPKTACNNAYLKISESSSDTSEPNHLLGQYCNTTVKPFQLASSTNVVYVYFKTTARNQYETMFRFEWVVSGCGGIFRRQSTGVISSPGYPVEYPHGVVCEWYLSVPLGSSIVLTVDDLQLEIADDCSYDSLQIFGGSDDTAPRIANLCKKLTNDHPTIVTTSGNNAFVRFVTDSSYKAKGFHASYKELPNSKCGGQFVSESGLIHSHNYPQNYDTYEDCVYLVKVDNQHRINLTFTDFDINAPDGNCTNAYVKVYDGESEKYPLLETLCGNRLPQPIFSSSNTMFVRHKTDGFSTAKGFSAVYKPDCGANLVTNSTGTLIFSEMNTTLNWSYDSQCKWIIKSTKPNSKITVQFVLLDIPVPYYFDGLSNISGIRSGVNIFAGDDTDAPYYGRYFQTRLPPAFTVSSSAITVVFKATDSHQGRFTMDYSVQDTACGGLLHGEGGIISSPNSPDPYPNNIECVWVLNAAPGSNLLFEFTKFDLQQSDSCNDDYVEVRQKSESGPLFGAFCGSTLPARIQSNATLWVKFRTGAEGTASGFTASYSLAFESQLEGFVGQIGSPFYPLTYYSTNSYGWRITVKPRHVIRIAFIDFYTENYGEGDDECFNKLMIYDGIDQTAPLLKELCGMSLPQPFSTGSNIAYIMLVQILGSASHFLLEWMQMERIPPSKTSVTQDSECRTFVELSREGNTNYTFTSPGYPIGYKDDLNCEWIFQAPIGDHVNLRFSDMRLESESSCALDSVTIFHEIEGTNKEWTEVKKLCHDNDTSNYYVGTRLVKVVFTSDFSTNRTGFSGRAETDCGGVLNGPNGVISEGPYSACQWNITVRPSRTIKITFTKFNLQGSPPCREGNYIIFRDGGRPDSPLLGAGKYCGSLNASTIDIPETTSNRLYILLQNKASEGLVMRFEEKSISCGGDIMLSKLWTSETISSPNYPNIPPPHTECIWRVFAPSGETLHFEVTDRFDMTPSRGCTKEYLELRDGSTENSVFIGRYCSITPNFVTTEGNALYIKYFTDTNDPKDGFRGTISMSKCGGTLYDTGSGSIKSPGYPNSYESNLNCTWRLVTSEYKRFSLNVTTSMGWKINRICDPKDVDSLTVTEASKVNISFIGPESMTICGMKTLYLESETNEILINFISTQQPIRSSNRFFIVTYSTKMQMCGGYLNLPSGIIRSPGYPQIMMGRCSWRIIAPEGRRITLNLIDFDLEKKYNLASPQRLSIYNGFIYQTPIASLVGNMPEQKVYESSGNKMMVIYTANRGSSHRGFIANYTSVQPAICGGKIDATRPGSLAMIAKQNDSYYCEWEYINRSPSNRSTITFTYSGTANRYTKEYTQNCYYAYSMVSFGDGEKFVGVFCSETKPNQYFVLSKPNDFSIVKVVKQRMKANLTFSLTWKIDMCGAHIKGVSETQVRSPGTTKYPPNVDCVWSISVPEGSVIKIHFDKFDLDTDCNHDYLKIYNGNSPRSPLMSHHCGNIVPADIITQANTVWLLFHSDETIEKGGFQLTINQVDSGCGGILHGKNGIIQSPSYPSNYKNNIECEWEIRVDNGYHIGLVFGGRFFIEDSPGCQHDYLQISDYVNGKWKVLHRICGRQIPQNPLNSTSNMLKILFKTNNEITSDGFKAVWEVNCGGVINVKGPGHLYSPGWPKAYFNDLDCNYTLIAPKKVITATFESFGLEKETPAGCNLDKVQIFIQNVYNDEFINNGIYCGDSKPPDQTSPNVMVIHFTSDMWLTDKGFSIAYDINTCGGEITEETVINSPKVRDMSLETRCTWNITAPSDRIIILKLSNLRLHSYPSCLMENIEVWDTSKTSATNNGTLLVRLCGSANDLPVFRSTGNKMVIDFKSRYYTERKGFTAVVSFTYGFSVGCGGTYSLSGSKSEEITINSPDINKDGKYENDLDCHWVVSSPSDNTLMVQFSKMNLALCNKNITKGGCCDTLEVYDGPSERNELIGGYCGTFIPRSITSSSNYLAFRFVTDGIGQAEGFQIKVSPHVSSCGASVLLANNTPHILTSPNYPESYPINSHCRWMIAGDRFKIINIRFIDLDIEETSGCIGDRLEIFDENTVPWKFSSGNNLTHRVIYSGRYLSSMKMPQPSEKNIFCGKGRPLDYYSSSGKVMVRFISDSQKNSKGFKIQYSYATCSRNYTAPYGRILFRREANNCSITISALKNQTISMYFSSLSIPRDADGCMNKLEIFEGTKKINEICGGSAAPPVFSENNTVTLRLTNVRMTSGFDMSYTTTSEGRGCGGTFHNTDGAFTSPMYPGNYRNYSYCCWEVTVPLPGVPSLFFYEFDLGMRSTCDSDYVKLFDVSESGEKILRATYCGGDQPARFIGNGQTVALCYKSSIHNGGLGWSARWSTVSNLEGEAAAATAIQSGRDTS